MKRITKRYFQLLEVMIAMTIVSLCAIPLIYPHIFMTHQQNTFKRELAYDHLANLIYADIVEQLYQNKINWSDIEDSKAIDVAHEHFTKSKLPGKASVLISAPGCKSDNPEKKNCLLNIDITVDPLSEQKPLKYTYNAFAQRVPGNDIPNDEPDDLDKEDAVDTKLDPKAPQQKKENEIPKP